MSGFLQPVLRASRVPMITWKYGHCYWKDKRTSIIRLDIDGRPSTTRNLHHTLREINTTHARLPFNVATLHIASKYHFSSNVVSVIRLRVGVMRSSIYL